MKLFNADNREALKELPDNSVDSVITDPPYGLSFMNKKWDYDVPSVEFWKEVYRVLKPGGHILSFGGTRTYHRMVVNIEDAGFEIRDQIQWIYGAGFPKSLNIKKQIEKKEYERCECSKQKTKYNLRQLPETDIPQEINLGEKQGEALFQKLFRPDIQRTLQGNIKGEKSKERIDGREKSCLEGWGDAVQEKGQLQGDYLQKSTNTSITDGEKGWIYNGAQDDNGGENREIIDENRSSSSYRPRPIKQQSKQSGTLAEQLLTQESRVEQVCSGCEKPFIEYEGWGSALKPANEPIVLARKPLSEKSISENVMRWRTGGLNIDGCRIGFQGDKPNQIDCKRNKENQTGWAASGLADRPDPYIPNDTGRFPANVILECICDEVIQGEKGEIVINTRKAGNSYNDYEGEKNENIVTRIESYGDKGDIHTNPDCPCYIMDEQSGVSKSEKRTNFKKDNTIWQKDTGEVDTMVGGFSDKGGASRFFYRAKVSKKERNLGLDGFEENEVVRQGLAGEKNNPIHKNNHPTLKPINLLTYLCRLITPTNGVVLDPFMGSGSTGVAALLEGFDFIGMELEKDYYEIAEQRIKNYELYKKILK